jgi:purine-binding chemotaxis protein CheW
MTDRPRLPASPRDRDILRRRAVRLANEAERARPVAVGELFLSVRLGSGELYGIPYRHLEEIVRPRGITPVPCTPDHIAGVMPRRGQLITVVALARLLPMAGRETVEAEARVVVVRAAGMTVGMLVDGVDGNDRWDPGELAPAPPSPGVRDAAWIDGIHAGRVAMLNMDALLQGLSIEETS